MRYEIKYSIDPSNFNEFSQWLSSAAFFRRAFPSRNVHSLYFDTAEMGAARDNLAGISNRRKYRLRWYSKSGSIDQNPIAPPRFEIKSKQGRLGWKHERELKNFDVETLSSERGDVISTQVHIHLDDNSWPELTIPLISLEPKLLVHYERQYLAGSGGMRVTIDRKIIFTDVLMEGRFRFGGKCDYSRSIVEFKFPPDTHEQAAEVMSSLPFYPVRNSKYLLGLSLFGHAVYI